VEALQPDEMSEVMALICLGVRALRQAMNAEGFNIGFNIGHAAGAGVRDHVHCHAVPRWPGDTNFMPVLAGVRTIPQLLPDTFDLLKAALDCLQSGA